MYAVTVLILETFVNVL